MQSLLNPWARAGQDHLARAYALVSHAVMMFAEAGTPDGSLLAMACLAEPGSEWLLTDPGYPCNCNFVRSFEGVPICIPVRAENNFQPTLSDLDQHWNVRTAGALLASPANPTGTLIADDVMAAIADFVRRKGGQLIVDEIYHGLTYDRDASTALQFGDDIFIVQSFSKYFLAGWSFRNASCGISRSLHRTCSSPLQRRRNTPQWPHFSRIQSPSSNNAALNFAVGATSSRLKSKSWGFVWKPNRKAPFTSMRIVVL